LSCLRRHQHTNRPLPDFRYRRSSADGHRDNKHTAKGRANHLPASAGTALANNLPLVPEDCLFFRIEPDAVASLARRPEGPLAGGVATLAQTFCHAFHAVWASLPLWDRQRLLNYWQQGYDGLSPAEQDLRNSPRPFISIMGGPLSASQVIFARLGHEMSFPAVLVMGQRSILIGEIARVLADTHRLMTRQHWRLVAERIDKPLECWEREEGATATDAIRDMKIDALEAEYLREYQGEISAILRNWGFEGTADVLENLPTL
jgi:hypothetical protein